MAIQLKKDVTLEELKQKIDSYGTEVSSGLEELLYGKEYRTDPHGVRFDAENITYDEEDQFDMPGFTAGYNTLQGSAVRWVGAGGDWEIPLAVCIYMDANGDLKVYVPKAGNVWNFETGYALGNAEVDTDSEMQYLGIECKYDMAAMEKEMLGE